ncbi:amino acid permease [Luteococcus peritonei]|uniref:Amino acid permease n=1 Tax=Luteococcus peritonei TaxID=88874 RepID=A0ABW4RW62_9ACTN
MSIDEVQHPATDGSPARPVRASLPPALPPSDTALLPDEGLARGLKARHLQMIALGSSIGTGLFLGSGASIQLAGPAVLLAFLLAGTIVFFIMRMLGEMAVAHPISGSFAAYAREYIGPAAGFVVGWNWWFTTIVVGMLELAAAGTFMDFWFPGHPKWLTAVVCLVAITLLNVIHVGAFGEVEFWMSAVKVVALVAMIVLGLCLVMGLGPEPAIGFGNLWQHGGFAPTGLKGILLSLVAVSFTFGGIVSIGTAAGEVEEPSRSIPRAINTVLVRIIIFYVGGVGIMLLLWPWNQLDANSSPFVRVLVGLGIGGAATLLNIVVIAAALSVFNTMTYSGARMLRDLARGGQAPDFFDHTNRRGVPLRALLVNAALMGLVVALTMVFGDKLLFVLISIIVCAELISWTSIVVAHLRFRSRLRQSGEGSAYRAPFSPLSNIICLVYFAMLLVLMLFLPDYRAGLVALPLWILGLLVIWLGKRARDRRAATR